MNIKNKLNSFVDAKAKELEEENDKVYDYLLDKGKSHDQIISYLNYKKDMLLQYKKTKRNRYISDYGMLAVLGAGLLGGNEVSNIAIGCSVLLLGAFNYNLVREDKIQKKYNDASDNLGLTFVKKI